MPASSDVAAAFAQPAEAVPPLQLPQDDKMPVGSRGMIPRLPLLSCGLISRCTYAAGLVSGSAAASASAVVSGSAVASVSSAGASSAASSSAET